MHPFSRSFLILLLSVTVLSAHSNAQHKQTSVTASSEKEVLAIRQEFQRINTLPLRKEQYTYEVAGCAEDGKVICYFSNKELVKITESGSIGDGSWVREFYYQGGKCIFCYEKLIGGAAEGPVETAEYRYYISNNKPVRCMENKNIVPADGKAIATIATALKLPGAYATKSFAAILCNQP